MSLFVENRPHACICRQRLPRSRTRCTPLKEDPMHHVQTILWATAFGMLTLAVTVYADSSPVDQERAKLDPGEIHAVGAVEIFVYSERGYAATVPVTSVRPNAASYGLNVSTELRARRVPRIL